MAKRARERESRRKKRKTNSRGLQGRIAIAGAGVDYSMEEIKPVVGCIQSSVYSNGSGGSVSFSSSGFGPNAVTKIVDKSQIWIKNNGVSVGM